MVMYLVVINSTGVVVDAGATESRRVSVRAGGESVVLVVKAEVVETRRRKCAMDENSMVDLPESLKLSKFPGATRRFENETDNLTISSSCLC